MPYEKFAEKFFPAIILLMISFTFTLAQGNVANQADSAAIRQTALDDIDGLHTENEVNYFLNILSIEMLNDHV